MRNQRGAVAPLLGLLAAGLLFLAFFKATAALVYAGDDAPGGATASPAPSRTFDLSNGCKVRITGSVATVTSTDGHTLFDLDLPAGACDVVGTLNQEDGVHVFFGTSAGDVTHLTVGGHLRSDYAACRKHGA